MKIYNVIFETHYENEDICQSVMSFTSEEEAREAMERELTNELLDWNYSDDEVSVKRSKNSLELRPNFTDDREWTFKASLTECDVKHGE